MREITALVLQTWFDIALQYTGSTSNAYDIAKANGKSLTDDIQGGQVVVIPSSLDFLNKEMYYFKTKGIAPSTATNNSEINEIEVLGIGSMIIETSFIVQ